MSTAAEKDFGYAPVIITEDEQVTGKEGLVSPTRAAEIVSTVQELVAGSPLADEVHFGRFDFWNHYNMLILEDPSTWDLSGKGHLYGLVWSIDRPLRLPGYGQDHHAIDDSNSFTLFYDDYARVITDDDDWANLIHAIMEVVPEIQKVNLDEI